MTVIARSFRCVSGGPARAGVARTRTARSEAGSSRRMGCGGEPSTSLLAPSVKWRDAPACLSRWTYNRPAVAILTATKLYKFYRTQARELLALDDVGFSVEIGRAHV